MPCLAQDAALDLNAVIAPARPRIDPRGSHGVLLEGDAEGVSAGVGRLRLASRYDALDHHRLHVVVGLAALAIRPDLDVLAEATKLVPLLGRQGRWRLKSERRLEPRACRQLRAISPVRLVRGLVVHPDALAVEAPRALVAGLVVPDAAVQLSHLELELALGIDQACQLQRLPSFLARLLVQQAVHVALPALGAHEVAARRPEAVVVPARLLRERHVLGEDLGRAEQSLVRPHGEEANVHGLLDTAAGAQELARVSALERRSRVALELDVLVVEGRRVVGVEAEDVQPHEILRPAPAIRLAGPPVLRPPLQGRRNGPSHRRHFHLVPVDQVPVARTQLLDILRGHQHQDVGAAAGLLGQRQGLDLQTVEEGQPWPSRPANVSVDEGVLAAPWGFRRTSVHIKAGGAPSFPVLAAPRATGSMVDLTVALSPQPHGLGSLRLRLLVVLLGHALPLDHLWRSLSLLHLLNSNRLFCSDDGRRRVHFTHFPDQSVAVVRMSVLCRRGAVSEVTLDHILHRRLLARQQRGAI
mmetsp:Transcript_127753/g.409026  ORF Transcript_127753/g.409026 Transcript_127753/m.409026 type:complete len:527 (+) Transcript_127753:1773-3353(+)